MKCFCGSDKLLNIYCGPIREGAKGDCDAEIYECSSCTAQRLKDMRTTDFYESQEFRQTYVEPDRFKITVQFLHEMEIDFYQKNVIDVGAGKGNFCDLLNNIANVVAIEPDPVSASLLKNKGYKVYSYINELPKDYYADYVVSFDVIEHLIDPVQFLRELSSIGKEIILTTPNRDDILMKLQPSFKSFWYRTSHNWYFDKNSLAACAETAGIKEVEIRFLHRFGMSNMLGWMKEGKPVGHNREEGINRYADALWKAYLEREGISEYLIMFCKI